MSFRDAFDAAGMDMKEDLVPLDIRDMTTEEAIEKVRGALEELGVKAILGSRSKGAFANLGSRYARSTEEEGG